MSPKTFLKINYLTMVLLGKYIILNKKSHHIKYSTQTLFDILKKSSKKTKSIINTQVSN